MQVRVPNVLGPGNTMLVHGMSFAVPEGIPSGAIIPVMIPIHPPGGGQHPNPNIHPGARQYGMNYSYQHAQHQQQHPHMMQHTSIPPPHIMMGGYYPNHNPHEQYPQSQLQQQQVQQPLAEANPDSWASKVASSSQTKITESDTTITGQEMGSASSASVSAPDSVATSGVGKGGRTRTKKEGSGASTVEGAGTSGTSDKSKDEGSSSNAKRTGRKKQQQQKEVKGDCEHGIKLVSNGAKKDNGRK